jgi:hypothetical protein
MGLKNRYKLHAVSHKPKAQIKIPESNHKNQKTKPKYQISKAKLPPLGAGVYFNILVILFACSISSCR